MICFKNTGFRYTTLLLIAGGLTAGMASCRKEYVDKYRNIPGDTLRVSGLNYISSFEVKEFDEEPVKAAITNDSIVVMWSSYKVMPDSIIPVIGLPDSASILPASGTKVAFKTGTSYVVTSGAGTKKRYTLKVDFRQPTPWFSRPAGNIYIAGGYFASMDGDLFLADTSRTRVYFVSVSDKKEYLMDLTTVTNTNPAFFVPGSVPAGTYDIKIVNGIHTVYNKDEASRNAMIVEYPSSRTIINYGFPLTVKADNTTFTLRGQLLENTTAVSVRANTAATTYYPLEIVSFAMDRIVFKVPVGTPAGTYSRLKVTGSAGDLEVTRSIIVAP